MAVERSGAERTSFPSRKAASWTAFATPTAVFWGLVPKPMVARRCRCPGLLRLDDKKVEKGDDDEGDDEDAD